MHSSLALSLVAILILPSLLSGQTPFTRHHDPPEEDCITAEQWSDWMHQDNLTGNWFGYRKKAEDFGLDVNGYFTTDLLGNPVGGFSQGFAGATSMGIQLVFDLEKIVSLQGTEFVASMIWRAGENLSADRIGNLYTVAQLYGGPNVRLYEFMIRQHLWDDQILLKAGRMAAFDDFFSNPIFWNYVNNGICGNPKGIFFSVPAFGQTVYPTSSWGLFAKFSPEKAPWYFQAGFYLLDSQNGVNSSHGLNWTFDVDQGLAVVVQTGYNLNSDPSDPGLQGQYSVGGFFSADKQSAFSAGDPSESNFGFYFMLQQMLYRAEGEANLAKKRNAWGPGAQEGLSAFVPLSSLQKKRSVCSPSSSQGAWFTRASFPLGQMIFSQQEWRGARSAMTCKTRNATLASRFKPKKPH